MIPSVHMLDTKVGVINDAVLSVENVVLAFGGLTVLNGISLRLQVGELLALIGPNGAGKTSVLNCISGLYRPSSGRILLGETNITGFKPDRVAKLGVCRTFQHGELFPQMSVMDNLLTARHARIRTDALAEAFRTRAVRGEEERHRAYVESVLKFVELERYRNSIAGDLSFGQQKVVGFARALAAEPTVLLLDEPSAGLSRDDREGLAYLILKSKSLLGLPMIWIEHDMEMVSDLADRIHVLDYGRSLADGEPQAVLGNREVIKAYLGES
ncbi:MAG: ABC transporter ATP-binding protein [Afipia sp.]|nr:ABC transporter ATP-binding protein [Afipia sp.]